MSQIQPNANVVPWQPLSLDGWWIAREARLGGVRLPDDALPGLAMLLFDHTLYLGSDVGTIDLDHAVAPAALDVLIVRGPNRWRFIPGIFTLSGRVLRICFDLSGAIRPTAFDSPFGSRLFVVTYERAPTRDVRRLDNDVAMTALPRPGCSAPCTSR